MNVEINEKLIEDSQKIELGIRRLQSKISNVIDRVTDKDADPKVVIQKYKAEIAAIKADLTGFLAQQKEFNEMVESAEKEITMMGDEVKKMMAQNNITIDESELKENTE